MYTTMTRQAAEHPVRPASCKHLVRCRCAESARLAAPKLITVIGFTRSVLEQGNLEQAIHSCEEAQTAAGNYLKMDGAKALLSEIHETGPGRLCRMGGGAAGSRQLDSATQASPLVLLLPAMAVLAICWLGQLLLLW